MSISREDVRRAHARIVTRIRRTPVLEAEPAAFGTQRPVSLKLDFLQHGGSFKTRGAFNSLLSQPIGDAGVIAASGGNHGVSVAVAAEALGVKATIFVPEIASPAKIEAIREHGADLVVTGANYGDAAAACDLYRQTSDALFIHPFDQPATIAGQGTVGVEWERQAPDLDTILLAVGGGGLAAGMAAQYDGSVRIIGVEPERAPTLHAALARGGPVDVEVGGIAADSLGARRIGDLCFDICKRLLAGHVLVSDDAIASAQRLLWRRFRIAVEPGGAAALAALLSGVYMPGHNERVGVLLCGGNVDLATLAS